MFDKRTSEGNFAGELGLKLFLYCRKLKQTLQHHFHLRVVSEHCELWKNKRLWYEAFPLRTAASFIFRCFDTNLWYRMEIGLIDLWNEK